jgi:hypothetical protein
MITRTDELIAQLIELEKRRCTLLAELTALRAAHHAKIFGQQTKLRTVAEVCGLSSGGSEPAVMPDHVLLNGAAAGQLGEKHTPLALLGPRHPRGAA